jgi:protein-disulfide isomerase
MTRTKFTILAAAVAVVAVAGYFAVSARPAANTVTAESSNAEAPAAGDEAPVADAAAEADASAAPAPAASTAGDAVIDVRAALADRSVGDPNAPVKMDEYASLSCPHCAAFTKETFPKIDENYIKTGKVYYTFHDFPLNAPALDAAMVARCLPAERYFPFIQLLFETQADWAFTDDPRKGLRQSAKLAGASDALVDACLANDELREGLVKQMEAANTDKHIESTPTFFLNDAEPLKGAFPYDTFAEQIAAELKKSGK